MCIQVEDTLWHSSTHYMHLQAAPWSHYTSDDSHIRVLLLPLHLTHPPSNLFQVNNVTDLRQEIP